MSKYTTEVRFICEQKSGLGESVGFDQIDKVLTKSWDKIFTTKCEFFDNNYRQVLCKKILKHYYTREIGAETVGLFKLWLNERMNEIMPKYNLMYSALDFIAKRAMPFDDTDLQTTHEGQDDTVGSSSGTVSSDDSETSSRAEQETGSKSETEAGTSENATNNTSASNQTNTTDHLNKYADTPQGGLSGLLNDTYLTNATKDDGTDTTTTSATAAASSAGSDSRERSGSDTRARSGADQRESSRNEQHNEANAVLNVRQYVEHVTGRRGGQSFYSEFYEMVEKLKSIDQMIIRDLQDLFMGVW